MSGIKLAALRIAFDKVSDEYLYLKTLKDNHIQKNGRTKAPHYDNARQWEQALKNCSKHCKELNQEIENEIKRLNLLK